MFPQPFGSLPVVTLGLLLAVALPRASVLPAQSHVESAGAANAYVDVLRTRSDLTHAAAELTRADALFTRALLSPAEHDERRAEYERARLAHLAAVIAAAGAESHVTIERAVKSHRDDGRLRVTLTLREASALRGASIANDSADDVRAELAALGATRRVSVALKTEPGPNGATISRPYERTLRGLQTGAARDVTFELLEDVRDIVVALDVGGRLDERRIRLEVASESGAIAVDAEQSSLEGDLGAQVTYALRLQRPRPSAASTRLAVRGLPPEVAYEFRDPEGRTRLAQLRFPDGATSARVQLAVTLPARPSTAVRPDAPLTFDVVAGDERASTDPRRAGSVQANEGATRLELVPRGIARLELRPSTLALQANGDGPTVLPLVVRNAGSGRIDDVRLRAEPPSRWQVRFEPGTVATLPAGDERRVLLHLEPPSDAVVGDYELRIGVDDAASARRIEVEDKLVRVHVAAGGGWLAPVLAAAMALGLTVLAFTRGRRWLNR